MTWYNSFQRIGQTVSSEEKEQVGGDTSVGEKIMSDPYSVLGVSRDASDDEIKKAYRSLVKKYHPDLHPNDEAAAKKMSEINAAYDMIKSGTDSAGRPAGAYGSDSGYASSYSTGNASGYTGYSGNVYEEFFGGFDFFGGQYRRADDLDAAEIYIRAGRYREAIQMLARVSDRTARWHYLYAIACYYTGNAQAACDSIRTASDMEPDNASYEETKEAILKTGGKLRRRSSPFMTFIKVIVVIQIIQMLLWMLNGTALMYR